MDGGNTTQQVYTVLPAMLSDSVSLSTENEILCYLQNIDNKVGGGKKKQTTPKQQQNQE